MRPTMRAIVFALSLLMLTQSARAQTTGDSDHRYRESTVFADDAESTASRADAYPPDPASSAGFAEQGVPGGSAVQSPEPLIAPAHARPLRLAPSQGQRRVIPVAATELAETADGDAPSSADPQVAAPEKLALEPPKKAQATTSPAAGMPSASTMVGSLAMVVGLFLLVAWVLRRGMPKQPRVLPAGILEVLGRAPLVGRQQVHLVRLGNKLLLLAITPGGIETLSEVTDPVEIDRLAGMCQQSGADSSTRAFNQVLGEFSEPRAGRRGSFSKAEPDFTGLASAHAALGNREKYHA